MSPPFIGHSNEKGGEPMRFFLLSAVLLLSPLWPLGANPLPGDPYIIVNKATNALAVVKDNRIEGIYQVATGKTDDLTPEGEFTVTVKAVNPYYRKKNVEEARRKTRSASAGSVLMRKAPTAEYTAFTEQTEKS